MSVRPIEETVVAVAFKLIVSIPTQTIATGDAATLEYKKNQQHHLSRCNTIASFKVSGWFSIWASKLGNLILFVISETYVGACHSENWSIHASSCWNYTFDGVFRHDPCLLPSTQYMLWHKGRLQVWFYCIKEFWGILCKKIPQNVCFLGFASTKFIFHGSNSKPQT